MEYKYAVIVIADLKSKIKISDHVSSILSLASECFSSPFLSPKYPSFSLSLHFFFRSMVLPKKSIIVQLQ